MPGKAETADFPTAQVRRHLEPGPIVLVSRPRRLRKSLRA